MDTNTHTLTVKRSWHFYDDAIIALASNLTLASTNIAWTTLASRLVPQDTLTDGFFNTNIVSLSNGSYLFPYVIRKSSNVQWFHVDGSNIGYLLQTQGQYFELEIKLSIKKNNYNTLAWINHGIGPYILDYQYIIVPSVSVDAMSELVKHYNQEQIFSCISTNNLFHGTAWPTVKRTSFVLWDNTTTSFTCNSQVFQLTTQVNDAVAASHPTRVNGTLTIIVNRLGFGEGCVMQSAPNASITWPISHC
ncbi:hypothetical protein I4U23_031194 [Adineta vaga]|nr:hypothetical protein I4U23_031194 [Adineta vaga]